MPTFTERVATGVACICVATTLAASVLVACLVFSGRLSAERWHEITRILDGAHETQATAGLVANSSQLSWDERREQRAVATRDLELRELDIERRSAALERIQQRLADQRQRDERLRAALVQQTQTARDTSQAAGRENVRLLWENLRPRQAKDQIMQMLTSTEPSEVVAILLDMPVDARAKIVSEFRTPEETARVGELLRLMRAGEPATSTLDKAQAR